MKILHLGSTNKFTVSFFLFLSRHFNLREHLLLARINQAEWPKEIEPQLSEKNFFLWAVNVIVSGFRAEKIVIHGLCDPFLVILLFFQPWLLKKCYWVIWGSDLYAYQLGQRGWKWKLKEFFRRSVIKRMGHLVTYIKGDVELARRWYDAAGEYHECLMYPSNIYREYKVNSKPHSAINIQVGNSADPSNNHAEVFRELEKYKGQNVKIYVPLSYGDPEYAKEMMLLGEKKFGEKFVPITGVLPFEDYLNFLADIDIAIFNHKRQQGMGNIITLLGFGKVVYTRSDVTPWAMFKEKGIKVFDIEKLEIMPIPRNSIAENSKSVKAFFSADMLISQWVDIFRSRP